MEEIKKSCITCQKTCEPLAKGLLKSWLADHGTVFSSVNPRPNSKYHTVIMTKRHTADLRTLTDQEWADILPVLKESIQKIENHYQRKGKPVPLGYRVAIPLGEGGSQNEPFHFYCRIVPKYKKRFGTITIPDVYKKQPSDSERLKNQKNLQAALRPNSEGVIAEKSKVVAKLYDGREFPTFAVESLAKIVCISGKMPLSNDIQAIDPATWNEIGQVLKETMTKIEENTDCHSFQIDFNLGEKATKIFQEEYESEMPNTSYPASEFVVRLLPRYKGTRWWCKKNRPVKKGEMMGTMEEERLAFKLREPEEYAKVWGKSQKKPLKIGTEKFQHPSNENAWKQPYFYLAFFSGAAIIVLGQFAYFLIKRKLNKK